MSGSSPEVDTQSEHDTELLSQSSSGLDYDAIDDTCLNLDDMFDVKEAVLPTKARYFSFGLALRLPPFELEAIQQSFPQDVDQALCEVLKLWLKSKFDFKKYGPPSWRMLVKAVDNPAGGNNHGLARKIAQQYPVNASPQEKDLREPPSKVPRVDEAHPRDIVRMKLSSCYTKKPEVPDGPWPPVTTSQFVALALVNSKQISSEFARETVRGSIDDIKNEKEAIEYNDVFEDLEDGARVLFEGRPGCGKTTLMHKTSQEWGNGKLLKDKLFFLIHLRRFANRLDVGLEDLIKASSADLTKSEVDYLCSVITSTSGKGVVFAIDGLDEYDPKGKENSYVFNLIKREVLPNSIVIVASRPAATQKFRRLVDKRVEVLGFLKAQIEEYVEIYFSKKEEKAKELIEYLKGHPNVFHICYIPLHVAMVSYLFDCVGSDLPATETEIYRLFMLYTLLRSIRRAQNMETSDCPYKLKSFDDLEGENKLLFTAICKLAFEAIISSKQVFSEEDVKDFFKQEVGSSGSDESTLGLVVVDRCFIKYGLSEIYSFLHLTIQEYLSAVHIASLTDSEQRAIIEKHGKLKRLEEVWKFYCGLVDFDTPGILDNFKVLFKKTESKSRQLFHLRCAFESQQAVLCNHILSSNEFSIQLQDQSLNPADCTALGYVLRTSEQSGEPCKYLAMESCRIPPEGYDALLKEIGECTLSIEKFMLCRQLKLDEAKCLSELLKKLSTLLALDLAGRKMVQGSFKVIAPSIPQSVTDIELYCNNIGDAGVEALASALTQCTSLQTLNLSDNNIGVAGAEALASALTQCTSLQTLNLSKNNIGDAGAEALASALTQCTSLQTLDLYSNNIGDAGAEDLASALTQCTSLQTLDLYSNNIGDAGAEALASALTQCTSLQTLNLYSNNIGDAGAEALASVLTQCTSLQTLDLSWNNIGAAGAEAVASVLTQCTSLQTLDLRNGSKHTQMMTDIGKEALRKATEERNSNSELPNLVLKLS